MGDKIYRGRFFCYFHAGLSRYQLEQTTAEKEQHQL